MSLPGAAHRPRGARLLAVVGTALVCTGVALAALMAVAMSPAEVPGVGRSLVVAAVAPVVALTVAAVALRGRPRIAALAVLGVVALGVMVVVVGRLLDGRLAW